ncbi:MAG: 4-(cytidine 5'-diphospho)-2-C-methyl-D-erythritol kinase [Sedimentisphaerales bacterium]|nr:4-(cytidine 5'-diphospho)-2-C-methyl-D-erythritol kinase [Sedimentisphaerales bacterium]
MKTTSKPQFEFTDNTLLARAPAKINLYLLIADKREDGFHNLETLMSKVTFYDELLFEIGKADGIELICSGLSLPPEDNLVYKACNMFYETLDKKTSIKVTLTKNIPPGTGLGGASSDAATTLLALNKLYNQPLNSNQLHKLAEKLGSDVPFFLGDSQALCSGRGEKILKLDNIFPFLALLILPDISVSTKEVYENFKVDILLFETLEKQIKQLICEKKVDLVQKMCANMLAKACFEINNKLALLKTEVEKITQLPVLLSGSGSALFVVLGREDYQKAIILQREISSSLDCNSIIVFNNQW